MTDLGDNIRAGMQAAVDAGKKIGRPRTEKEESIEALLRAGWTQNRVQRHLGVGTSAVRRVRKRMKGLR